jgi:hypothetical protein
LYQIFGVKTLAIAYAAVAAGAAVVFVVVQAVLVPPSIWGWPEFIWKPISIGLSAAAFLLWLLGQTRLFPMACRHRWTCNVFPDLDGNWEGNLTSNWPVIEARGEDGAEHRPLLNRPSTVRIHASLLEVRMTLETKDAYSNSTTILVGAAKDKVTGTCALTYVFRNETPNPKVTDEQSHFGAAVLTLKREGDELVLTGPYWTNRNWRKGLNTAGIATFRKRSTAA